MKDTFIFLSILAALEVGILISFNVESKYPNPITAHITNLGFLVTLRQKIETIPGTAFLMEHFNNENKRWTLLCFMSLFFGLWLGLGVNFRDRTWRRPIFRSKETVFCLIIAIALFTFTMPKICEVLGEEPGLPHLVVSFSYGFGWSALWGHWIA